MLISIYKLATTSMLETQMVIIAYKATNPFIAAFVLDSANIDQIFSRICKVTQSNMMLLLVFVHNNLDTHIIVFHSTTLALHNTCFPIVAQYSKPSGSASKK